jgi:hypothetical protein
LKANLASPTLTGTPAGPTATAGTNTTQLATTAFVVAEIAARLASNDAMIYKGAIDASTNPNYPAANAGDTYRISVAGKIGGASGPNVEVGDMLICHTDSSSSGNHATVGSNWDIIQTNIDGVLTSSSIGSTVQAWDADLDAIAAISGTSGLLKKTGTNTWSLDTSTYLTANQTITLSGAVTGSGTTAITTTIANSAVTLAKMADVSTGTVFYRKTSGTGAPETQTLATLKSDLGLTGTNSGDQTITLTGDVTGSGTGSFSTTIASAAVSLSKMANLAANSIIGNNTGSAATPIALTKAQVLTLLNVADGATVGATWGSNISSVPAILTSLGSLSNASGWLKNNGSGTLSWATLTKSDVGLGSVENTALSTWTGNTSITSVGTIATGTWNGSVIGPTYLGTGTRDGTKFLRDDGTWQAVTNGTVTSVDLAMPSGIFTVSNNPVTSSGTLTVAYSSQSANLVLASPDGSSGTPTFRALTPNDITGSVMSATSTALTNFNILTTNRINYALSGATNAPDATSAFTILTLAAQNTTNGSQLAHSRSTNQMYVRAGSGSWGSWNQIWTAADFVPANGTWSPTFTNIANCSSFTVYTFHYIRIGNQVVFAGTVVITPTAGSTTTQASFTVPIASALGSTINDAAGTVTGSASDGFVRSDGSGSLFLQFTSTGTSTHAFRVSGIYTIN